MNIRWLLCLIPFFITGCMGIDSKSSPSDTFTVNVGYEEVYRRAYAQAERCWQTDTDYPIGGGINQREKTSQLYVSGVFSSRLGEVNATYLSETSSEVKIIVWGFSEWGPQALQAMKEVIQFGVPTCTSYMPRDSYQISK